jgi:hypothetical protein
MGNGNGFLLNTLNYFTSSMLLTLLIYLVFRKLFYLLFNIKISQFLRQYSFSILIPILILEGNTQYMIYLFSFETKTLFYNQITQKYLAILTLLIGFMLILVSISIFWMIRYFCVDR